MKRIRKGDTVKVIAGSLKGTEAEVERVDGNKVYLKGQKTVERHYRSNMFAQGGKREIQLPIDISNVALVVDGKTTKVAYKTTAEGKVRIAKSNGKEIK
jgi:large subunit ribosomal protein L24